MKLTAFSSLSLAVLAAVAAFTPAGASADTLTLNAVGGPLNDATSSGNGITFFSFDVPSTPQTVNGVNSLTLTSLSHSYVSDLYTALIFIPDDTELDLIEAVLFDGINDGDYFSSNNLNGIYTFTNLALSTLQAATQPDDDNSVTPSGSYLPSEFYFHGDAPEVVDLSAVFAGIDVSKGTFIVYFEDFAEGDSGAMLSATLSLDTTIVPEPASIAALGLAGAALRRRRA